MNLNEQWQNFLRHHPDARLIVEAIMSRTGFRQGEVLFYLLEMWAEQNFMSEQQPEFDGSRYLSKTRH